MLFEKSDFAGALTEFRRAGDDNAIALQYSKICETEVRRASGESNYSSENDGSLLNSGVECGDAVTGEDAGDIANPNQRSQSAEQEKYWHMTVLTGYQFDSNVSLEPEFQGLGSNRGIEDSSWLVATYGDYQVLHEPDWNVGVIGSAFSNFYFSANEFDLQDFMGGTYTNRIVAQNVMASLRYEFHEILLGSDPFVEQHRLVPNLTFLSGDWGHTTMYYEFDNQSFETRPLVPAMNHDGQTHAVGATQAIYTMKGLGRWYFGYRFAREITDGTDFDGNSHMVTARVERPTGCKTIVDAEVRQFWDDYSNPNSLDFFDRPRHEPAPPSFVPAGNGIGRSTPVCDWTTLSSTRIRTRKTYSVCDSSTLIATYWRPNTSSTSSILR